MTVQSPAAAPPLTVPDPDHDLVRKPLNAMELASEGADRFVATLSTPPKATLRSRERIRTRLDAAGACPGAGPCVGEGG